MNVESLLLLLLLLIIDLSKYNCYTIEFAQNYFKETLVIILFNFNPHIDVIINHYNIWKYLYPNQLIVGHFDSIKQKSIIVELRKHLSNNTHNLHIASAMHYDAEPGFLNYKALYYAINQLKNYNGYLFLHDDMAINMTKFLSLNLNRNKIWQETWTGTFGKTPMNVSFTKETWGNKGHGMNYPWFDTKWGIEAFNKMLEKNEDIKSRLKECNLNNADAYDLFVCESDFVYFPSSVIEELKYFTKIFSEYGIFLEMALPTIIECFLSDIDEVHYLPLCTFWDNRYNYALYQKECITNEVLYHPLKLTQPGALKFMKKLAELENSNYD